MKITELQLSVATGCGSRRAAVWLPFIQDAMDSFNINTPERIAAFLSQVAHESGRLVYVREIWGPTPAQRGYEGRADLGNTEPGDGKRFAGHGLIQITGRYNHALCRDELRQVVADVPDFEEHPEALETPEWAAMSAAWYWARHGCNELADAGDFVALTRRINGGTNGLDDRMGLWENAKEVLCA